MNRWWRVAPCTLIAAIAPTAVMWLYLTAYKPRNFSSDYLAMGVAVIIGLAGLNGMSLRPSLRILLSLAYITVMGVWVFVFGAAYVCGVYHSCL